MKTIIQQRAGLVIHAPGTSGTLCGRLKFVPGEAGYQTSFVDFEITCKACRVEMALTEVDPGLLQLVKDAFKMKEGRQGDKRAMRWLMGERIMPGETGLVVPLDVDRAKLTNILKNLSKAA